jgi:cellulose synthase (UDP-forming)
MLTGLHIPLLVTCCALVLLLTVIYQHENRFARAMLCLTAATTAFLYLDWRTIVLINADPGDIHGAVWVWSFYTVEIVSFGEFFLMLWQIWRLTDRTPEADASERHLRSLDPADLPEVDAWVATYNEERPIIEKTIIGLTNLDWPSDKLKVFVLDDGKRDWLRDLCSQYGVHYVTRPDNKNRKAGNHNHALSVSKAPFIVSMDADFIPYPSFIYRTLGFLLRDPTVAIVQTPQCFYNAEPMRKNLGLDKYLPDELEFFYRIMQPGRDHLDAAFYCGSAALLRRQAIVEIGGFVTKTDIEDQATSVKLLTKGYKTRYLNEQLSVGLAAESAHALHDQRDRWCRGSLQILFTGFGPFGRGLSLTHRLMFLETHWLTYCIMPLLYVLCPVFFLWFGWNPFPAAHATDIFAIPMLACLTIISAMTWLGRRSFVPVFWQALQLFMAFELLPTALSSLVKPFGRPIFNISPVTAKGEDARGGRVDRRTLACLMALIILVIAGLVHAAGDDRFGGQQVEMATMIFWTIYLMVTVAIACCICFEPRYVRSGERFGFAQERATLIVDSEALPVSIMNLSLDGARVMLPNFALFRPNKVVSLQKRGIAAPIAARVAYVAGSEAALSFVPNDTVRYALVRELYADAIVHKRMQPRFKWTPVLRRLLRLLCS